MAVFVKTLLRMDTHMPGVRVTPLSTLLTIQHTHTWPLGSLLSNASAAHTREFPYGPWKWIRRWTSLTSHAPALSSFGCCVVCVCPHTSGGWVRETGWGSEGALVLLMLDTQPSQELNILHSSSSSKPKNVPFLHICSSPLLLQTVISVTWLVSPPASPFFPPPTPCSCL